MRERDFIARLKQAASCCHDSGIIKGIGDDCAVIKPTAGTEILLTTDAMAENTHFSRKYFHPHEIGFRVMAANISDICAMGGLPRYALASVGFPAKEKQVFIDEIFNGMISYGENFGVALIGGDTVRSSGLFISLTLTGEVPEGRSLTRSGAKPGDSLYVTGRLGASHAGLQVLQKKGRKKLNDAESLCVKKHIMPVPRFAEASVIAASGMATSCIDVSDGLVNDAMNISQESGCGFIIEEKMVPVAPEAAAVSGRKALDFALYGGEDFELLFTVRAGAEKAFEKHCAVSGMRFFRIGRAVKGRVTSIKRGSRLQKFNRRKIWSHF